MIDQESENHTGRQSARLSGLIILLLLLVMGLYLVQHGGTVDPSTRFSGVPAGAIPLLQHALNPSARPFY
jgi:hypothetical protein